MESEKGRKAAVSELREKRAELIASLQADERERQWHYTQLELISAKLRCLPLTTGNSILFTFFSQPIPWNSLIIIQF